MPARLLSPRAAPLLLVPLCAALALPALAAGELYRNEGLRALVAQEALRDGNWLVPRLYGEPLLTKPPGMTVAIALASWPFGEVTAASARLPSAVAAAVAVVLFYLAFARALGRGAGLVAALALPCSLLWLDRAASAEIDMLQLAWVTAAVLALGRALEAAEEGRSAWAQYAWWQAALLAVCGGLLTKWTAPAFFYLTALPLLLWRKRLGLLWRPPHLASAAVAAALFLAWAGAAAASVGPAALAGTVRQEALQRLSPAHHPRPYPWGELITFPIGFLLANLPWSMLALLTLRPGFPRLWDERGRRLLQLLHCWAWANLLFWTLAPGHRPRHALPLQPALAGLAAMVWVAWRTGRLRWPLSRPRPTVVFLGLVLAWLVGSRAAFVGAVVPRRDAGRQAQAKGRQLADAVPPGEVLYLLGLKDEGLLFYYGRPARRLPGPAGLPAGAYCLLREQEWRAWPAGTPAEAVARLRDQQGVPLVLARGRPERKGRGACVPPPGPSHPARRQ